MLLINTNFNPFRMKLSHKEPVELTIDLINKGEKPKMLTMNLKLSAQLSLEKTGYKTEVMERIPVLRTGEKKEFFYKIFPKAGTRTQEQPIIIEVLEHFNDYKFVANQHKKKLGLLVED